MLIFGRGLSRLRKRSTAEPSGRSTRTVSRRLGRTEVANCNNMTTYSFQNNSNRPIGALES
jgi:hypothetical protein